MVFIAILLGAILPLSMPLATESNRTSQTIDYTEHPVPESIFNQNPKRSWDTSRFDASNFLQWSSLSTREQKQEIFWEAETTTDETPFGTPHPPIYIDENSDFESWPGEGTVEDPYIISNLQINATTGVPAIYVTNTDVHFFIKDCWLTSNSTSVVLLNSVTHARISNNTFVEGERAIAAYDTLDLTFFENEFYSFGWAGVYLENCSQGVLRNNNCTYCFVGLHVEQSDNILVKENFVNGSLGGIDVYFDCEFVTVFNNTLVENEIGIGLYLGSSNNIVDSNNCTLNRIYGVYAENSDDNDIINNYGRQNYADIHLLNCTSYLISGNDFRFSTGEIMDLMGSISLRNSNHSIITNNHVEESALCIVAHGGSSYNTISSNNCSKFLGGILSWFGSHHNTIFNNTCDGLLPGEAGIYTERSDYNTVSHNRCNHSYANIAVVYGNYNEVRENDCFEGDINIYLIQSYNTLVKGNELGPSISGLIAEDCMTSLVIDNFISNATGGESAGMYFLNSTGATVEDNQLLGNEYAIYMYESEGCEIRNNTCIDGDLGVVVESSNDILVEDNFFSSMNDYGIVVADCLTSMVTRNTCVNISDSTGICLGIFSAQVEVSHNDFSFSLEGIYADGLEGQVIHNSIENCTTRGLHIMGSLEANVTWNIFEDNGENARDDSLSTVFDYNFWSNYTGIDANADGIGDTWHPIDGSAKNNDTHPLVYYPTLFSWAEEPTDQELEYGEAFTYTLDVVISTMYAPVSEWWINDTHFVIDDGSISDVLTLNLGEYPLEVRAYNLYGSYLAGTFTVTVTDTIAPTIIGPEDFDYIVGQVGRVITWIPEDRAPASYSVSLDGVDVMSGAWNSTIENITVSVDGLSVGTHIFELRVVDTSGNSATHTVVVTVRPADFAPLFIVAGVGGVMIVVVIVIYLVRKKGSD